MKSAGSTKGSFGMSLEMAWRPAGRHAHVEIAIDRPVDEPQSRRSSEQEAMPKARNMVADKLARMIHTGVLQAGDLMPSERDLCEMFRVARQTVRAAFGLLEGRLMIAISHGRRSRVLGLGSLEAIDSAGAMKHLLDRPAHEIAEVRPALETHVAALAAKSIGTPDLRRLAALVEQHERMACEPTCDMVCYQVLDFEFHSLIYQACGNKLLADIALDFYAYSSPRRREAAAQEGSILRSLIQHKAILNALRAQDPEAAKRAMGEHASALPYPADLARPAELAFGSETNTVAREERAPDSVLQCDIA